MIFSVSHKYLLLPASLKAAPKRLLFYIEDRLVYDLVVSLDYETPDTIFPVDISRFHGQTLRLECDPETELHLETTDEEITDYSGKYRPRIHFTAKRGWINDPNGLTYYHGKYLMYFQHNPAAITWENMHWGSAVSTDLLHWTQGDDVLIPDEHGTIFSGSAIVDSKNRSGLKSGPEDPILYFYTSAGNFSKTSEGSRFTQRLAYSLDGGKTLIKYPKPILDFIVHENRDPKVIYHAPTDSFILALFLDEHEFALFTSDNLLDWTMLQRIEMPEDAECPDFYPLPLDGDPENLYWILSAASDRYYVGTFDGKLFTPMTGLQRLHYGNGSYAAQSWSDEPKGRRIRTAFASQIIPGEPYGSLLDLPQEMTLRTIGGSPRLCANPISELSALVTGTTEYTDLTVENDAPFQAQIASPAVDITLSIEKDHDFDLTLYGLTIHYDAKQSLLLCNDREAPVIGCDAMLTLRIIFDTIYTEIYADEGSVYMGMTYLQDALLSELQIRSQNTRIASLRISELRSIYE